MIQIEEIVDRFDRKKLTVDQSRDDQRAHFKIALMTSDLPTQFMNNPNRRKVDMGVIDLDMDQVAIDGDAILIPLQLIAISRNGDTTRWYYGNKFDGLKTGIAPSAEVDCYIVRENDDTKALQNPYLLMFFTLSEQDQTAQDGDRQSFTITGNGTGQQYDSRQHVDRNENANGGINLPAGQAKSDEQEEHREEVAVVVPEQRFDKVS